MATSLEISKKRGPDQKSTPKMLSFGEKTAKIGLADLEIICLREIIKDEEEKKKETEGKIYSPSGKFAEWAKNLGWFGV